MKYVNLGCGGTYHSAWVNIDLTQTGPEVISHNLLKGVPLPDKDCDVVYHSHFIEHLRRPDALFMMSECLRILKPGGILRIAIPDLEQISRLYLQKLQDALDGKPNGAYDYEWMMLEMYDQTVREYPSGEMGEYLKQDPFPNEEFVVERIGAFGRDLIKMHRGLPKFQLDFSGMEDDQIELAIGRFRRAGEIHQWMYDRFSLAQLMLSVGFINPKTQSANTSQIEDWSTFNLDTLPDGAIRKPDSLFMEAIAP